MDKNAIKKYAVWARNELIARVTQKAEQYEITEKKTTPKDADSINGRLLTDAEKNQRKALIEKIQADGFEQVMEEVAYTWFNRFTALRFMEVNNYLPSHTRVFTNEAGEFKPQILTDAIQLDLEGLDMDKVFELKDANKTEELYKYLLITQCNALSAVLPRMFQKIEHYTELLLPDYLLREGSVIEQMISMIPEDNFDVNSEGGQIEIIGWLYQYYISEKHEEVVDPLHGKVVKKEEVPAATQLFTTDWVVRYLIDNSVGRYWIEHNPGSTLVDKLTYYVKPKDGTIKTVNEKTTPQDVTTFDPCVGSGHFLIYAFDVLMKIYVEYGYSERDAAAEIVKNNLFGLDIDGRASQLAYFSVMMKARQYDRRFFSRDIQPHIYEITESNTADKMSIEYFYGSDAVLKKDIEALLDTLKDAKEYGSILQMPAVDFEKINERFAQLGDEISMYNTYLLGDFQTMIRPAEIMSGKYAVVATNPPYMNKYDAKLKDFINENFKDYSGDLFSVFIYRNFNFCKVDGYSSFMTPNVWLFITSYEKLRSYIIAEKSISTLVQMAKGAFFREATVDVCAFVMQNRRPDSKGLYIRLEDFKGDMDFQNVKVLEAIKNNSCDYFYETEQSAFLCIESNPIVYWADDDLIETFKNSKKLREIADAKVGLQTGENNVFLRMWYEVSYQNICFDATSANDAVQSGLKWFPYNKGGAYRKWYGNNDYIVNWLNDGWEIKHFVNAAEKLKSRPQNTSFYFRPSITWSYNTTGLFNARIKRPGFIFDVSGVSLFINDEDTRKYILGLLCSSVALEITSMLNPTINMQVGDMQRVPVVMDQTKKEQVVSLVDECISITAADWDDREISWDFISHPLISNRQSLIKDVYAELEKLYNDRFAKLKNNEEEINDIFESIYGMKKTVGELPDSTISVQPLDKTDTIIGLLSYAVGCMFGRYSLDVPGLVYAGGTWDASKYTTFQPDKDAIIPICDDEYFNDDIVGRFVRFIEVVYGKETLEENLKFIADALGGKGTSREVIRNYFINDFYADHLKVYQKRPIYWLFDSGKKNGFKCLVYMHRYHLDTVARIRTDYVHEQQSRYRTAIADLEQRFRSASGSDRVRLNKQLSTLKNQAEEIQQFEEKIHHLADQMISIDLDDGVKHNYEIFKDVLAKIK